MLIGAIIIQTIFIVLWANKYINETQYELLTLFHIIYFSLLFFMMGGVV